MNGPLIHFSPGTPEGSATVVFGKDKSQRLRFLVGMDSSRSDERTMNESSLDRQMDQQGKNQDKVTGEWIGESKERTGESKERTGERKERTGERKERTGESKERTGGRLGDGFGDGLPRIRSSDDLRKVDVGMKEYFFQKTEIKKHNRKLVKLLKLIGELYLPHKLTVELQDLVLKDSFKLSDARNLISRYMEKQKNNLALRNAEKIMNSNNKVLRRRITELESNLQSEQDRVLLLKQKLRKLNITIPPDSSDFQDPSLFSKDSEVILPYSNIYTRPIDDKSHRILKLEQDCKDYETLTRNLKEKVRNYKHEVRVLKDASNQKDALIRDLSRAKNSVYKQLKHEKQTRMMEKMEHMEQDQSLRQSIFQTSNWHPNTDYETPLYYEYHNISKTSRVPLPIDTNNHFLRVKSQTFPHSHSAQKHSKHSNLSPSKHSNLSPSKHSATKHLKKSLAKEYINQPRAFSPDHFKPPSPVSPVMRAFLSPDQRQMKTTGFVNYFHTKDPKQLLKRELR